MNIQESDEFSSVKVAVRIKPNNSDEKSFSISNNTIILNNIDDNKTKSFTYDYIYQSDTTQENIFESIGKQVIKNAYNGYNSCVFAYGQTGCFAKGTSILLHNGKYINVEDIKLNDTLMGDDCTPRKVLQLFRGRQDMYEIIPDNTYHTKYTVNQDHYLVLAIDKDIEYIINDEKIYLKWFDWSQKVYTYKTFELSEYDIMIKFIHDLLNDQQII